MAEHLDARYWIDNRSGFVVYKAIVAMATEAMKAEEAAKAEEAKAEDTKAEATEQTATEATADQPENAASLEAVTVAEPQNKRHDGIVEIILADDLVSAKYRKSDAFRKVVKELSFVWDPNSLTWRLPIGATTGTARYCAAELGNHLLNAGFAIRIADPSILAAAISGSYEPMSFRWISALQGTDCFFIKWAYGEDFYYKAKSLPGSRYVKPGVTVPASEYRAVFDFAATYGFKLTPGAQALIAKQQASVRVVTPAPSPKPVYDEHPLSDVLSSSADIIDDLKDDDDTYGGTRNGCS